MTTQLKTGHSLMAPVEAGELTLGHLWNVLRRRKGIIVSSLLAAMIAAVLLCTFTQRRYRATGEVQVEKGSLDGLGLSNLMGAGTDGGDALDGNITIQTEATILQSDTLALKVIKDLNLEATPDFGRHASLLGSVLRLISVSGPEDPKDVPLDDSPVRRSHALIVFSKHLKVRPVAGTRLIQVTYESPDPKLAATVVNHLIQALSDFGFQTKYDATSQASQWLGSQLSDLRKQSEDLQTKVVQLERDSGMFAVGGGAGAGGKAQAGSGIYSSALDRLQQATASLSQAESNRILKGAVYQVAKSGDPELISGLAGNAMVSGTSSGVANSLSLIQNLRMQQAALQGQLGELSSKFGPAYPKLEEIRANIGALQKATQEEIGRIADRAKSDYEISQTVEQGARAVFVEQKQDADRLNDKAIEYTIVRQEAEQTRELYQSLLGRLKEAGLLEGLRSSNISIVDPARTPARPATPNVPFYLATSVGAGVFAGCFFAVIVELHDRKIWNLQDLESRIGDTSLGILPAFSVSKSAVSKIGGHYAASKHSTARMIAAEEPNCAYTEALRGLRTSLLLSRGGAPPQTILVTSSIAGEGKTTLSVNLAILLAKHGKRVLLVDADLRRPTLHRVLGRSTAVGLSSLLTGQAERQLSAETVQIDGISGLEAICAGPVPPYPSELLGSEQMRLLVAGWRKEFDFIVLDGAPILPVTDSVIVSEMADTTLLLARFGMTEQQSLERSYLLLRNASRKDQRISVVVNAVEQKGLAYQQYYGYSESPYQKLAEGSLV